MKVGFLAAALAAAAFAGHAAVADPFPKTVVATKIGYQSIAYTVKKGATLKNIAIPVTNRPVRMMVTNITPYYQGVGDATLIAVPGVSVMWVGTDTYAATNGTTEHGSSQNKGTHMLWADYAATVDVQIEDPTTLQIHNGTGEAQNVIITFTW